ncbi:hypothetical protein ABZ714_32770 [Streptomyces sp. NPDC006798]|uniref:hypothetical protein n=1 Tax=Streptomyces sp. NPDC006798 TaxID=3155462 RepID=UPI0033EE5677
MVRGHGRHAGRLTLFLALLFGVVTMHTVGHPSPGHGGGTTPAAAHAAPSPSTSQSQPQSPGVAHAPALTNTSHDSAVSHASPASWTPEAAEARPPVVLPVVRGAVPGPGSMDPTTVCLAVLGVFGCALLVVAGVWLRRRGTAGLAPRAGVTAVAARAGPPSPPPRIRLAQLSVLRI